MGTIKSLGVVFGTAAVVLVLHKPQAHAQSLKINNPSKPASQSVAAPADKVTVLSGDTLSVIAEQNATTWQRIFDANQIIQNPNLIYPGESLRIPNPGEKLVNRSLPAEVAPVIPAQNQQSSESTPAAAAQTNVAQAPTLPTVSAPTGSVWDRLAQCESGGNWAANTGNGFYGGLQFSLSSWQAVGGSGYPNQASRSEQIARATLLQARQGWGAWPVCSLKIGL